MGRRERTCSVNKLCEIAVGSDIQNKSHYLVSSCICPWYNHTDVCFTIYK